MKKILVLLVALISLTVVAQETKIKSSLIPYVGASLSMTNTQGDGFDLTSYASLEFGVTKDNVSVGLVTGRGSLRGLGQAGDKLRNYFYEVKVSPSFPLGHVNGNVVLGVDSYFAKSNATFIEYGVGVSKSYGNLTFGLTYSNWDSLNYVTPSISLSL